jgi:hypothetical protein
MTIIAPSGDKSGATDTQNIQSALNSSGSAPVGLEAGTFYLDQPLLPGSGSSLLGSGGACQSSAGAGAGLGTVLMPVSTWTTTSTAVPNGYPAAGVITFITGNGTTSTAQQRMTVSDLWIDGSTSPSGVDGIAAWGAQNGVSLVNIGVYAATGNGFAGYQNSNTDGTSPNQLPDGWYFLDCLAQACTGNGVVGYFADTTFVNVHAQSSGASGFYLQASNNRLISCRADISKGDGFLIEAVQGTGGYLDAVTLDGCGTQRNGHYGLNVVDPSASGEYPPLTSPVLASGCTFDGDGVNNGSGGGGFAGIRAAGEVILTATGCQVLVHYEDVPKPGCPEYAFRVDAI